VKWLVWRKTVYRPGLGRGGRLLLADRKCGGSDPAGSATSMRRKSYLMAATGHCRCCSTGGKPRPSSDTCIAQWQPQLALLSHSSSTGCWITPSALPFGKQHLLPLSSLGLYTS